MPAILGWFWRGLARHGAAIAFLLAVLSLAGVVYLRMAHTAQSARADAVSLGLAQAKIGSLRKEIDQQVAIIDRLQADAQCRIAEQVALSKTRSAVVKHRDTVRQQRHRLHEDTIVRTWGDTPLPVDIARLHNSPALTGAHAYLDHLPLSQPVLDASHGTTDQR